MVYPWGFSILLLETFVYQSNTALNSKLTAFADSVWRMVRPAAVIAALSLGPLSAKAEVTLPRLLSDGLIVQRDQPISIWGWASDESSVTVRLAEGKPVKVDVVDGQWQVDLPARRAGGPYVLQVTGSNTVQVKDVWVGEVWIASGQSNMELPMYRVRERFPDEFTLGDYPKVRQFRVPKEYDYQTPREDLSGGEWVEVSQETLGQFSAVGYYFAKSLYQEFNVPVGIVLTAYGGATAEGWMSEQALKQYPHYHKLAKQLANDKYLKKIQALDKAANEAWYGKLDKTDRGLHGGLKWYDPEFDFSNWPLFVVPGYWEDSKHKDLQDLDGVVWFNKSFDLPKSLTGRPAQLKLGRLVDADTVYVNGQKVGGITYQYPPRRYDIPADVLREGRNTVSVRLVNNSGKGGFVPDNPYLIRIGNKDIDLTGEWHYQIGTSMSPLPPSQFNQYLNPLGFFNAMLAPLFNFEFKGVIWYQGESNVSKAEEYADLFPAMIRDWRRHFNKGPFPFVFVQLANYLEPVDKPVDSAWAAAREAQRGALQEPNTAMAVAIDVGEWNDIHPLNKKAVGERLALAAGYLAYGDKNAPYSGPHPGAVKRAGSDVIVAFDHVAEGLVVKGDSLGGFAIAGSDKRFVWADAKVKGNTVVLSSDKVKNPVYVRYAWADNPVQANLYNSADLPAVPFEAQVQE